MAAFPKRGEIWLVDFPDDPKLRPALIVSIDARNELANSVLAVPVTTNLRPAPTHVLLPAKQGGLTHDSVARCENVSYLHKSRLSDGPLGGKISPPLLREVENCLLRSFGINAYLPSGT
jgi:mRNA interferase MazF